MNEDSRNKGLKNTLFAGAAWDFLGGIVFFLVHGLLQKELTPEIHPFYSIVVGTFLFMLAYIQFITSANPKQYCSNIGVVIFLRVFYGSTVVLYSTLSEFLPAQFFIIATIDIIFVVLLVFFATKKEAFKFSELFVPQKEGPAQPVVPE